MQKTVKIGDREVALRSSAATPYRYTQIFHENFFEAITKMMGQEAGQAESIDVCGKLAFVMASQASGGNMDALNFDKFTEWLDDFEFIDFSDVLGEVVELYMSSSKGDVQSK